MQHVGRSGDRGRSAQAQQHRAGARPARERPGSGTGSTAAATAGSTSPCTWAPSFRSASTDPAGTTTCASSLPARHHWKRCAASSAGCPTSCSELCSTTSHAEKLTRAREDTRGRLCSPARLAQPRQPALRTSHFPDPQNRTLRPPRSSCQHPLDREGSHYLSCSGVPWAIRRSIYRSQNRQLAHPVL